MSEKFDPAPFDKYAESPTKASQLNKSATEDLKSGLVGTFPASDPVSVTQPPKSKHDENSSEK